MTKSKIKQKALELGFDAVGITTAEPIEQKQVDYYAQWLRDGHAAEMAYLHRNCDKRFAPAKLLAGAKSVICVALNYRPAEYELIDRPNVRIGRFAQYEDYHPFIRDRLFQLAEWIQTKAPNGNKQIKFKACVDSAPLAERTLAQRAGLGFIGRNHMLINPALGSELLLGELLCTLALEPDAPFGTKGCGQCGACIRACPTGALSSDGSFDAQKCISYQTIEAPDKNPKHKRNDNYIFGCDECILVCPYNQEMDGQIQERKNPDFEFHPEWQQLTPEQIQNMTEEEFQKMFANSGFIRLGLERLKRNAACIGQS